MIAISRNAKFDENFYQESEVAEQNFDDVVVSPEKKKILYLKYRTMSLNRSLEIKTRVRKCIMNMNRIVMKTLPVTECQEEPTSFDKEEWKMIIMEELHSIED